MSHCQAAFSNLIAENPGWSDRAQRRLWIDFFFFLTQVRTRLSYWYLTILKTTVRACMHVCVHFFQLLPALGCILETTMADDLTSH